MLQISSIIMYVADFDNITMCSEGGMLCYIATTNNTINIATLLSYFFKI